MMKYKIFTRESLEKPLVLQYANTKEGAVIAFKFADAADLKTIVVERGSDKEIRCNLHRWMRPQPHGER